MDIEKIAIENPEKIITTKVDLNDEGPNNLQIEKVISMFNFTDIIFTFGNEDNTKRKIQKDEPITWDNF